MVNGRLYSTILQELRERISPLGSNHIQVARVLCIWTHLGRYQTVNVRQNLIVESRICSQR